MRILLALADPAPPLAPAAALAPATPAEGLAGLPTAGGLGQTLLALLVTCLLAALVLRLLRPRALPPATGGGALRLLARLPLGEAQAVYLLRAAGRYLLVGGSPGGLALICELDGAEAERALRAEAAAPGSSGLLQRLRAGLGGGARGALEPLPRPGDGPPAAEGAGPAEGLR